MKMNKKTNKTNVQIRYESPSGKSLAQRVNALTRYYAGLAQKPDNDLAWIAEEFKKSLIRNIENGVIVVEADGKRALA
jgi:hypothetical protein